MSGESVLAIRSLLITPFIRNLEEISIGEPETSLSKDEIKQLVALVSEYFGEDPHGKPIQSRFTEILDEISERIEGGK